MTYWQTRGRKYKNVTCTYGGHLYHSIKEANYAAELDLRVRAKDIRNWKRQVPLDLCVNGYKICTYRIDFEIEHLDGSTELVEVKGFETPEWRLKWKLLEAIWSKNRPEVKLTVVR